MMMMMTNAVANAYVYTILKKPHRWTLQLFLNVFLYIFVVR